MENNSIREFTCNDCQEVTKVDWSKVRPDIDDGTSNIEIHEKGNGYAYYGECMNCGNLVEIEPPTPELVVDNVDVDKDGMYIQLTDTVTNRSCWIEAWQDKNGDWEYDFNQYIFHLDNENDIVAKMFQEDLGNYAEDVFDCVMGAINEHEEEYNKLQENKAPTMRDRLKEAKRNRCEHKKTEALDEKNQEAGVCPVCGNTDLDYGDTIMEQVGDYYGYNWKCSKCNHTGTEWYYMSFVDVYNTNTGEESHQEGICPDCGSDLMYDNFVPDGMDGYYEVYCDNCGFTGKEDYNLDFTDHTVNEEINESKEVKTEEDIEHFKEILALELTEDRLKLMNVDEAHFSEGHKLSIYQSFIKRMNNIKYIDGLIQQYEAKEINTLNNTLVDLKRLKNMMLNKEESKKVEAKFKDKVKAIKKSLKKNDKRLSDETAEKSAEKIAGSMVKKEESKSDNEVEVELEDLLLHKRFVDLKDVEKYLEDNGIRISSHFAKDDSDMGEPDPDFTPDDCYIGNIVVDGLGYDVEFYVLITNENKLYITEVTVLEQYDESKKVTESKTADMDTVDIITELEGGELTIADVEDWNAVKSVASDLQNSQGFYGRLLRDMLEAEEEFGGVENLPFPITM